MIRVKPDSTQNILTYFHTYVRITSHEPAIPDISVLPAIEAFSEELLRVPGEKTLMSEGFAGQSTLLAPGVFELDGEDGVDFLEEEIDITCGDWMLWMLTFSDWKTFVAGESKLCTALPVWTNNPDAPILGEIKMDWNVPGFEGIQWGSSDESVLRCQPMRNMADADAPWSMTWLAPVRAGTASVRLTLPNGTVLSRPITVEPAPAVYSRPVELSINPTTARPVVGGSADLVLAADVPDLQMVVAADWVSTDPSVAVLGELTPEELMPFLAAGKYLVRVKGLKEGNAVITLLVMVMAEEGFAMDYLTFGVVVSGSGGGGISPARISFEDVTWQDVLFFWRWPACIGKVFGGGGDDTSDKITKINNRSDLAWFNVNVDSTNKTRKLTATTSPTGKSVDWEPYGTLISINPKKGTETDVSYDSSSYGVAAVSGSLGGVSKTAYINGFNSITNFTWTVRGSTTARRAPASATGSPTEAYDTTVALSKGDTVTVRGKMTVSDGTWYLGAVPDGRTSESNKDCWMKSLGTLSSWRSDYVSSTEGDVHPGTQIARWGASTTSIPKVIYYRQISTGNNLNLKTAMQYAVDQWNDALGLTGTNKMTISSFSGNPPSGAQIYIYGGTTTELEEIFGKGEVNNNGAYDINPVVYEGTWLYGTGASTTTKEGRVRSKSPKGGWVRRHSKNNVSPPQDKYNNIAAHELGHALGFDGHSDHRDDIMDRWNLEDGNYHTGGLTKAEKNHVRQAYGLSALS